jgi:hypothetical protein
MMFDDSAYRNKPGFIYLIHAQGTDRYKIGLTTRSVQARLAELNSSQSPYPLEVIDWFETPNVTEDEKYFHDKYSAYRVHGEWFQFDRKTLNQVLKEYQGDVGFSLPQLPRMTLPALPELPLVSRDKVALAMASIGALWLMVIMSGWLPKTIPSNSIPEPPPPSKSQLL